MKNIFTDSSGNKVLAQRPNAPLYIWLSAVVIGNITSNESIATIANTVSFIAIVVWAGMEIFWGANTFRRLLGLIIGGLTIYLKIS